MSHGTLTSSRPSRQCKCCIWECCPLGWGWPACHIHASCAQAEWVLVKGPVSYWRPPHMELMCDLFSARNWKSCFESLVSFLFGPFSVFLSKFTCGIVWLREPRTSTWSGTAWLSCCWKKLDFPSWFSQVSSVKFHRSATSGKAIVSSVVSMLGKTLQWIQQVKKINFLTTWKNF